MDRKTEQRQRQPQSPTQHNNSVNPVVLFKDISNFKTPKRPSLNPNLPSPALKCFTASKDTPGLPSSIRGSRRRPPKSVARKLKAFELEQSQSSRKAQIKKEQSVKILSKSLTVWLNFLFENPELCGCGIDEGRSINAGRLGGVGKRGSGPEAGVGVDAMWREPKRQRGALWSGFDVGDCDLVSFSSSRYSALRKSLSDICSFDDLAQRMRGYLSLESCREVFDVMTQVAKNIDEGRLKMKVSCPIVTDFGMRDKALGILLCYNIIWLRIGLYVILGGDSLLDDEDLNTEQEITFLKMIIEKQFFTHMDIAKAYAYNKKVEGLYKPGYYEALGSVILKRFLLLVLVLDRAKSQSSLPLKYGIDGLDGGSPLLFSAKTNIKSSRQVIDDFLSSDVMHGEGNLLAHLVIVGYKVSYQQGPLLEYDFRVTDLFQDFRDGVRLCRVLQLLLNDSSILMKIIVPSDSCKKNQANCVTALRYLRQAGVSLHDGDGEMIEEEDVANGDKELVVCLLWNVFVHLQLPRLIDKTTLAEEISRIRGHSMGLMNSNGSSDLDMLLSWIKVICETYEYKIDNLSSLCDGKAIWCILDYYFRKELHCSASKDQFKTKGNESIMSATDYTDAVHNFLMSQKLTTLLGNFPEVLQVSDILEHKGACNNQSVVILLVFLASQLMIKKNMDLLNFHKLLGCSCQSSERRHSATGRSESADVLTNQEDADAANKFKAIQAWWKNMAEQNNKFSPKPITLLQCNSTFKHVGVERENAAIVLQSNFKRLIERQRYTKRMAAVSLIQTVVRAWLAVRHKVTVIKFSWIRSEEMLLERNRASETYGRYVQLFADRLRFVKLKASVLLIQRATRNWTTRKCHSLGSRQLSSDLCDFMQVERISLIRESKNTQVLEIKAAAAIRTAWKKFVVSRTLCNQQLAAIKIQSHLRGWLLRRKFLNKKQAAITIQGILRVLRLRKIFHRFITTNRSAIIIQSFVRRWIVQRGACRLRSSIVVIQKHCRSWKMRRDFLSQREAAITLQRFFRCLINRNAFLCQRIAAVVIQRCIRRQIIQHGNSYTTAANPCLNSQPSAYCFQSCESKISSSILKLQRWWRCVLLHRTRVKAVVVIQAHFRGWICRQKAVRIKHYIVLIQSHWKGYIERKYSRKQLLDLRFRIERTAANVDDSQRLINRLLVAVAELLSMRSVSGILHTCATLDMATKHSQRCCEELVAAGAVATLLKLIRSVSRSIPDQEVLKYSLSTLRNLARYPHLAEVLIDTNGSVETILWQFLRNKEEGYFIASELLKKICKRNKGMETLQHSPAYLKRIYSLVEELTRKANIEKRNTRGHAGREQTDKRLREVIELWRLLNISKS